MENTITYEDLAVFGQTSDKCKNDSANKMRENIICAIINNKISTKYYETSNEWRNMKKHLIAIIEDVFELKKYFKITCIKIAGRKANFDFSISIYITKILYMKKNIEFKFNAKSITKAPQFLSLASNFNTSYAEYFYDTYNQELTQVYDLPHISRVEYLNDIHKVPDKKKNNANVHEWFNKLKKQETNIKKKSIKKKIVDKSIHEYLTTNINKIDIDQLNEKLYLSQKNKNFIMYCPITKNFYADVITDSELTIVSMHLNIKKNNLCNNIICDTLNPNTKLVMLLRWKNTNGILFPAWQISIKRSNK
jgi:hypothetical protein